MNVYNSFDWRNYILNYPDLKQAGIDNCEKAWAHYQKYGKYEGRTFTEIIKTDKTDIYQTLYKNCSLFILDFSETIEYPLQQNKKIKMYSSTPCIIKHNSNYILNVRYVNYIIKEYDPHYTYSVNKCIIMDSSFNILSSYFHHYNFNNDEEKHKGLEDIKLFNDNEKLYYIGNIFRYKKSNITIDSIDSTAIQFKEKRYKTTFNQNKSWEKNWCFVKYNDDVCVVYNWFPIKVCKIDQESKEISILKEIKAPSLFENVRGSTNGVIYNDEIWFITHTNNKGDYYHLFVVFDCFMNFKRYSNFFKFENYKVEFCLGFLIEQSRVLISYSTNDSSSKVMVLKNFDCFTFTPFEQ